MRPALRWERESKRLGTTEKILRAVVERIRRDEEAERNRTYCEGCNKLLEDHNRAIPEIEEIAAHDEDGNSYCEACAADD
jgi:uncharacterized protein with PIN domain